MKAKTILTLVVLMMSSVPAAAQEQTGSMIGNVTDDQGAAIAGVQITVSSPALIGVLTTSTNNRGFYAFPALPVGKYTVTYEAENYREHVRDEIDIHVGDQIRVNISLEAAVIGHETIHVIGESPLIDVQNTDTGMNISRRLFRALPKDRDFTSVVRLAPGANVENIAGGLQIDGASIAENTYYIDGVDITSFYTGLPTQTAAFEFVEEVEVRSGGYQAEFGGSLGGVVNVITRSGGNDFSGELNFFFNADELDSNPRPTLRINPVDDMTPEYITYPKDEYSRYEFGGGIGGYLLRDRLWFFGSYMPAFTDTSRNVDFRDNLDNIYLTGQYSRERRMHRAFAKLTAQIENNFRVNLSYLNDYERWLGDLPSATGDDAPSIDPSYRERGAIEPGYDISLNADYMISSDLFANFKGGYHRTDYQQLGSNQDILYRFYGNMAQLFADDPGFQALPSERVPPPFYMSRPEEYETAKDLQEKMNWSGDVTYFFDAIGSHTLKAGAQYNYIRNDVQSSYTADYIFFVLDLPFVNSVTGEAGRGPYGFYFVLTAHPDGRGKVADVSSNRYALFLQDSWRLTDKLTINAGLRAEKEDIPSFSDLPEYSEPPISFGFLDKLAPRIGVSYDVRGNGTLKLYGNYGRYYDVAKLAMALESYGGFKWQERFYTLDTLEWWKFGGNDFGPWPRDPAKYPGTLLAAVDHRIPAFDTTDPNMMPTSLDEYILGMDYQLADDLALDVRFVHKHLNTLIEDVGVNTEAGMISYITNPGYGYSVSKLAGGYPPTPKAKRNYWALEMRLNKRFNNRWIGGANLTFSRLTGNISGLANTDYYRYIDYDRASAFFYFDQWFSNYDANWQPIDGPLPTDRRYSLKLFGSYAFDFGLTFGLFQTIQDGNPITTQFPLNAFDSYMPYNRGDKGRYPIWTQTDLYSEWDFDLAGLKAQVNLNVTNLFDQDTVWRKHTGLSREEVRVQDETLLQMYQSGTPVDISQLYEPYHTGRYDPRYMMDSHFQAPRTICLGLKLAF
ncbi:MAG TPA: TonB-dependent receptor [Acidobacteriota bacterium]|nr:TonB-dependent receptor [Acidobacteriota bacterium]